MFSLLPLNPVLLSSRSAFLWILKRAMESPVPSLCPSFYHSMPVLLCAAACIPTSQALCNCVRLVFLFPACTLLIINISLYAELLLVIAIYRKLCLCPTKINILKNKLDVGIWSVREVAVTGKSKTKLQADEGTVQTMQDWQPHPEALQAQHKADGLLLAAAIPACRATQLHILAFLACLSGNEASYGVECLKFLCSVQSMPV